MTLVGLFVFVVAFGCVPMAATIGPCAFVPCDRLSHNTAEFTVTGAGARALVVPRCVGEVRSVAIETYPRDGSRQTLWSISAASPTSLPETIELDRTPPGFRQGRNLEAPLPVGEHLWVEVSTRTQRFVSTTYAVDAPVGLVGSGERGRTAPLDSFTKEACAEVAYVAPTAPAIALVAVGIGYLGIPLVTVWLIAHHLIERRRQGPPVAVGAPRDP